MPKLLEVPLMIFLCISAAGGSATLVMWLSDAVERMYVGRLGR